MDPQPRLHPIGPGVDGAPVGPSGQAAFAHASEAELARILDFYGVAWEYEPRAFPLMWNLRGEVRESFTPDFYLQDLDLYVELTTLRQKLVRKKNRKLRRLRELYPDVRVKLLYAKDFRALMLKFGRIGLADALSGTVGQTTPPRATRPDPAGRSDMPRAMEGADSRRQPGHDTVETASRPDRVGAVARIVADAGDAGDAGAGESRRPRRRRRSDA
jgi:hypothetical protein